MKITLLFMLVGTCLGAVPANLAVYYGWPIAVNGKWAVSTAAAEFDDYDVVIFGAGLEDPAHSSYQDTSDIVNTTTADVFGYIDATLSQSVIEAKIDDWAVVGGSNKKIVGIFCDQFGFDYGLNRARQNSIVDYIHSKSLSAFVNAWDPDDVFVKSQGKNTKMTTGDIYMAESHHIINGAYQTTADWEAKSDKMASHKSTWGSDMACITTTTAAIGFDQTKWDNAYYACAVYDFDYAGWGEPNYSASDALLPFRSRADISGTEFTGSLVKGSGIYERQTNIGVGLDTITRTVYDEL